MSVADGLSRLASGSRTESVLSEDDNGSTVSLSRTMSVSQADIVRGIQAAEALAADSNGFFRFGDFFCKGTQAFFSSKICVAFVNLRPIMPGHVLVCPARVVERFSDLTDEETFEVWRLARDIGAALQEKLGVSGMNFAIQDGKAAGQTVPHVHIHIIPRKSGDLARNDEVYEKLEEFDGSQARAGAASDAVLPGAVEKLKLHVPPDSERKDRSEEEMAAEAKEMRELLFQKWYVHPTSQAPSRLLSA
eukprot:CAMPEP_0206240368 /NCGR_PEP_ID=MMETSP0047_2-20121206/15901_1 /ASSEMBLY_ACC=CAM_ASM_000192 /TAXON_ID=195065 /ORGANISM="Chroomonas mesostigmatica_cf, Strain CCMP1168" /LENGTH=247 /DNA_ID=CAMNT_0053665145 /DNA_START=44 /DNA_END=787 /DNA_ORIENTATION=+